MYGFISLLPRKITVDKALMEEATVAKYAPAVISAIGALLGVLLGAMLERQADVRRLDKEATEKALEKLWEVRGMCRVVLNQYYPTPERYDGEKLTSNRIREAAVQVENHAKDMLDDDMKRRIVNDLRCPYDDRRSLMAALDNLIEDLRHREDSVVLGARERHSDNFNHVDQTLKSYEVEDDFQWRGPAHGQFMLKLSTKLGVPMRYHPDDPPHWSP